MTTSLLTFDEIATSTLLWTDDWPRLLATARAYWTAQATLDEIHAAIPATFYAGLGVPTFRIEQLVRVWNNAVVANTTLETENARLRAVVELIRTERGKRIPGFPRVIRHDLEIGHDEEEACVVCTAELTP